MIKKMAQRYIVGQFIFPFLFSCFFFLFFLLSFQLLRITKLVINKDVSLSVIIHIMGHIAISFLPMAVPLAVLLGTLYCLNRLSLDSEILAMRSIGLSNNQLVAPFLVLSFLIGLSVFSLNYRFIPASQKEFRQTLAVIGSNSILSQIHDGEFFTDIPFVTLYADHVTNEGTQFENIFIHFQSTRPQDEKVIYAKHGYLIKEKSEDMTPINLKLRLTDGNILKNYKLPWKYQPAYLKNLQKNAQNKDQINIEKILFQIYEFPLLKQDFKETLKTKEVMRSTPDLWNIFLSRYSKKAMESDNNIKLEMELWDRSNTPFLCLVFSLLGFSLGIQRPRGKNSQSAVLCFGILICYYAFYFWLVALAKKGLIPPLLSSFFPTFLLGILSTYFFLKQRWPGQG
jgi:lipopolysaccharide export system permease protein